MLQENTWLLLSFVALCLVLALLLLRRSRRGQFTVDEDKSGFRRYHKETVFRRKDAYGALLEKDRRKQLKSRSEAPHAPKRSKDPRERKAVAVISFQGDIRARQHLKLASMIDEIELNADRISEVVACISSPGGAVPHYGHAFAEMARVRRLNLPLTVCIDVVAASGGYLMSLPANKIIASPFAIVGSVGVVAFVPNVRKLLTRLEVNPRTFTAGKYKRTVTLTDEDPPEAIAHFQAQLETIHEMFSQAVGQYRRQVKLEEVCTGDHWTAQESIDRGLGLVDELGTSHEYLIKRNRDADLVYLDSKRSFWDDGMGKLFGAFFDQAEERLATLAGTGTRP